MSQTANIEVLLVKNQILVLKPRRNESGMFVCVSFIYFGIFDFVTARLFQVMVKILCRLLEKAVRPLRFDCNRNSTFRQLLSK